MEKVQLPGAESIPPLVTQLRRPSNPVYRRRLNCGLTKSVYALLEPLTEGLYVRNIYDRLLESGLVSSDLSKGMRAVRQALNYLQSNGYVKHHPPRWSKREQTPLESLVALIDHAQQMKISTVGIVEEKDATGEVFYDRGRRVFTVAKLEQTEIRALFEFVRSRAVIEEYYMENVYDGYIQIYHYKAAVHAYTSGGACKRHLTLHVGLRSIYAFDAYANDRARVLQEFSERFAGPEHDRELIKGALLDEIFSVNDLKDFDLRKFAKQQGIAIRAD